MAFYSFAFVFFCAMCFVTAQPGDWPEDVMQHPYCSRCLEVVRPLCTLTRRRRDVIDIYPDVIEPETPSPTISAGHPNCDEFLQVSYRTLCSLIGVPQLCYAIKETKPYADSLVSSDKGTPTVLCTAIEMC